MAQLPDQLVHALQQNYLERQDYDTLSRFAKTSRKTHAIVAPELRQRHNVQMRGPHERDYAFTEKAYDIYRKIPQSRLEEFWKVMMNVLGLKPGTIIYEHNTSEIIDK
jgi:hypothetical protein